MKLAFFGTPKLSSYVLDNLIKEHSLSWVLSQCDKDCGRGLLCKNTPVKQKALEHNIKVFQPKKLNRDFFNTYLSKDKLDLAIVVAYGQYIPSYLRDFPKYGTINIHLSLLPKYRGAAPVHSALLNNEGVTGVSIIRIARNMDEGPILAQKKILIDSSIQLEELSEKLIFEGIALLKDVIKNIKLIKPIFQDNNKASYASKVDKNSSFFSWNDTAISIHNKVRAFSLWPGVFIKLNNKLVKIIQTTYTESFENFINNKPGEIVKIDRNCGIYVKTGSNLLVIKKLQVAGKKAMDICSFINGNKISEGMIICI
jgi:methionyl-tRNA formyltransferase